jgi:hypothetical protein
MATSSNPPFGSPAWRAKYAKYAPKNIAKANKHNKKHSALLEQLAMKGKK